MLSPYKLIQSEYSFLTIRQIKELLKKSNGPIEFENYVEYMQNNMKCESGKFSILLFKEIEKSDFPFGTGRIDTPKINFSKIDCIKFLRSSLLLGLVECKKIVDFILGEYYHNCTDDVITTGILSEMVFLGSKLKGKEITYYKGCLSWVYEESIDRYIENLQ